MRLALLSSISFVFFILPVASALGKEKAARELEEEEEEERKRGGKCT